MKGCRVVILYIYIYMCVCVCVCVCVSRVVIDTAPTGHTLRLLEYPRFISTLLNRVKISHKLGDSPANLLINQGGYTLQCNRNR
jgi:hypothetical protein